MSERWDYDFTPHALRDLKKIDMQDREAIINGLDKLVGSFEKSDVKKLRGYENEWRLRVGSWRVRFVKDVVSKTIIVNQVKRREDAYR